MTALLIYILWALLYISLFIIMNIIFLFFYKNKLNDLNEIKSNFLLKTISIIMLNKKFKFSYNISSDEVMDYINIERNLNWPILSIIHNKIIKSKKKLNKNLRKKNFDNLSFKKKYKNYSFYKNNFNLINILNVKTLTVFNFLQNDKILYQVLLNIVNLRYFFFIRYNNINLYHLLFNLINKRFSISDDYINVYYYNLLSFKDYLKYCNTLIGKKNYLILNNEKYNAELLLKKIKKIKINTGLFFLKNNYYYLNNNFKQYFSNVDFNIDFLNTLKNNYNIIFSSSNIVKYLSSKSTENSVILYLRKNKIFNKGRYSRNRQTYRTGAYWCLYVNIIAIVAFYFWFYKFTINFGYLWWLLYSFIFFYILPRSLKYKFYNLNKIFNEFFLGLKWFVNIIILILKPLNNLYFNLYKLVFKKIITYLYIKNNINLLKIKNYMIIFVFNPSFDFILKINNLLIQNINKYL